MCIDNAVFYTKKTKHNTLDINSELVPEKMQPNSVLQIIFKDNIDKT